VAIVARLLSPRGLIAGFAVGVIIASAGFAVAQDSVSPEPPTADTPTSGFAGPESLGFIPEQEWRESQGLPPLSEAEDVDFAAFGAFKFWADACREQGPEALGMKPLHCEANIALAEGRLAPGAYSDAHLRAALGK
jgi:hypothetical protein